MPLLACPEARDESRKLSESAECVLHIQPMVVLFNCRKQQPLTESGTMSTIYHVIRGEWDGGPIEPLQARMQWSDETSEAIAAAWPDCDPAEYYFSEGAEIHCHETIEQASEFAAEYGGVIVAIDASGLDVRVGREYPHPVLRDRVTVDRVEVIG